MNLCTLLDMAADGFGDRPVIGTRANGFTPSRLRRLSHGGAELIRRSGGDALIYLDANGPTFPLALFSAARAAVPFIPMNYRLGDEQLAALLGKHPKAIAVAGRARQPLVAELGIEPMTSEEFVHAAEALADAPEVIADSDAPAVIIYTSGTTAEPKGVLLRHHNLVSYVCGTVEFAQADEDEAALISVPPYHVAAVANALTNLYAGRRCVVLESFDGATWLDHIRQERITHALVVPTMLARILSQSELAVPSLRTLAYGGASMPASVIESALICWPHVDFVNAYGLTETSSTISVLGPQDHREAMAASDAAAHGRLASVGRVLPTVEIEVRDGAGGALPPGRRGRIFVRGAQVSGEYAGTGSALDVDGWFDTRDEGHVDQEGYLFVAGRADDTIIRGAENIAPAEIEATLLSHPDIVDAVVVGVPDPEWGQHLEAAVVLRSGRRSDPETIRDYTRSRLRGSKTPDRIVVWDEMPRTETGKLIRRRALERILDDRQAPQAQ